MNRLLVALQRVLGLTAAEAAALAERRYSLLADRNVEEGKGRGEA